MAKPTLALLVPLALAACSPEPPPASRNVGSEAAATAEAGEGNALPPSAGAASAGQSPRLARLKDSAEGDSAAHEGTLEIAGPCIFVSAGNNRSLIASTIPGARWDSGGGVLIAGVARLRPGTRIFLSGSFAETAKLKGQWIEPPAEECLTPRAWIASAIRAR